eukprot:TRINITY_DN6107_c0_g1_i2.p3 TRINITY_DN6107_c0_g1~~TRINITY_DN6107_c0_g1_i2.p3  ORF type:complete len:136 (-),score=38.46 TRINITY_DN6107_c0_g1_i2:143-550(-)
MAGKAAASSAAAAPAAGAAEAGEFDPVPFEVFAEPVPGKPGQSQSRAVFRVPEELVDVLVQRSIAARSAHFELRPGCGGDAGTFAAGSSDLEEEVHCVFYSPKPERTADAIARRIARRVADPDGAAAAEGECVIA